MDLVILIWPLWTIGNPTAGQAPMWFFKKQIIYRMNSKENSAIHIFYIFSYNLIYCHFILSIIYSDLM